MEITGNLSTKKAVRFALAQTRQPTVPAKERNKSSIYNCDPQQASALQFTAMIGIHGTK